MNAIRCNSAVPRVFSLAVLVLALLTDSALAQKAEQPDVKVGDQWQFVMYYNVPSTKPNRAWVITPGHPHGDRRYRERGAADADPGLERS